ncbi:MAG: VWA domain-containing protein [Acidobacteria bacterium]|nr:VWA domain-containing protein [Acidobacteriota bacterium]
MKSCPRLFLPTAAACLVLALSIACKQQETGNGAKPDVRNRTDDWCLNLPAEGEETAKGGSVAQMAMPSAPPPAPAMADTARLGLATGGAKDAGNFRENIRRGYLPLPTDLAYEGLFYDYYFDQGPQEPCKSLFCPAYAAAVSKDPISGREDLYLSVGLQSGLDASTFTRKKLNLVVVLDISGSMSANFRDYYYDASGSRKQPEGEAEDKSKMQVAKESLTALLGHLKEDDRLGVVLFDDEAYLAKPLRFVGETDVEKLKGHLLELGPRGGTNMEAGIRMGADLFKTVANPDPAVYENRILFLTDAMPNTGVTDPEGLLELSRKNADRRIFTTFIGVGVDFNTELVAGISKVRGCNYYSVHSSRDFRKRLDEEFAYMVTPLVFNLRLALESPGYRILKVYGSPEADQATGELMKVATLFPSKSVEGKVKGGIVLLKLRRTGEGGSLSLKVSWEDRSGKPGEERRTVSPPVAGKEFYAHGGIRKAVLLTRYADMLLNWMSDERETAQAGGKVVCSVTPAEGIRVPETAALGRWERTSMPLAVSAPYADVFRKFRAHFAAEMAPLNDPDLKKEVEILDLLTTPKKAARVAVPD